MTVNGHATRQCAAAEALARLKSGNERFLGGTVKFATLQREVLAQLTKGQQPDATILGCSDSRVLPELVFEAGFGGLFVVRVAGNVLDPSILGTLQYAGMHLRTPLFVLMGHEGCGAVQTVVDAKFHGADFTRVSCLRAPKPCPSVPRLILGLHEHPPRNLGCRLRER